MAETNSECKPDSDSSEESFSPEIWLCNVFELRSLGKTGAPQFAFLPNADPKSAKELKSDARTSNQMTCTPCHVVEINILSTSGIVEIAVHPAHMGNDKPINEVLISV